MFFISQIGPNDCAFTCLKILLANYHKDKNYLFLDSKDEPYNYKEIIEIASEHHMKLTGIKVTSADELLKSKDFPLIVTLEKEKGIKHSVLILGVTRKYAKIFDPAVGKRRILLETLYEQWNLVALVVDKSVGHEKVKLGKKVTDFIEKKDKLTLPIWQLLSGVSLLTGVYFVNKESYFFIPVIFFALFIVFEILFRKGLIDALKRMDENYFSYEMVVGKEKYQDVYQAYEKYRYTALTIIPNLIYTLLISIAISSLLIMNGIVNIAYISLGLVIAVVHTVFYKPFYQTKSNEIAQQEKDVCDANNQFQFHELVERAHQSAYQVALSGNLFSYLEIAVLLMTSITIMSVSGIVNIIYVVFYLCISVYLKDNFIKMFEYSTQSEEFDNLLAKLHHYINSEKNNSIV